MVPLCSPPLTAKFLTETSFHFKGNHSKKPVWRLDKPDRCIYDIPKEKMNSRFLSGGGQNSPP